MDAKKREIRTIKCELAVREAPQDAQGESRTITGRAIVFNAESETLDEWGYRFREVIKPEACTMEFLNSQDVKMNMLHDRSLTIARCNKGEGSMRLSVDEQGVSFEFDAPKCDIGDRCLEMVRRGDYSGCSFEFYPEDYDVEEREGGKDVKIIHKKFRALTALTIGMDPAYKQTTVNAREMYEGTPGYKAEQARLAEEQKQREAEEQERIKVEMKRRERVMAVNEIMLENSTF
jgi:HK97 family phage prohead protease